MITECRLSLFEGRKSRIFTGILDGQTFIFARHFCFIFFNALSLFVVVVVCKFASVAKSHTSHKNEIHLQMSCVIKCADNQFGIRQASFVSKVQENKKEPCKRNKHKFTCLPLLPQERIQRQPGHQDASETDIRNSL